MRTAPPPASPRPAASPVQALVLASALLGAFAPGSQAQELGGFNAPRYAPAASALAPTDPPAGVFPLPVLARDDVELTLSYTTRRFDGLRDGRETVDPDDVLGAPFAEVPVSGSRERFELALAWSAAERITLGLVLPLEQREREVRRFGGGSHAVRTSGLGDVELLAAWKLLERGRSELVFDLGLSTPTGAIDESAQTPSTAGQSLQLPYELQLGSGSFEILPGLTWSLRRERWSFGARARARLPLDTNERGWQVGERFEGTSYASFALSQELAGSVRVACVRQEPYHGADEELDPSFDPGQDPARLGRSYADLLLGFAWSPSRGNFSSCRLAIEGGLPMWEDVEGPALASDWTFALGLAIGF